MQPGSYVRPPGRRSHRRLARQKETMPPAGSLWAGPAMGMRSRHTGHPGTGPIPVAARDDRGSAGRTSPEQAILLEGRIRRGGPVRGVRPGPGQANLRL